MSDASPAASAPVTRRRHGLRWLLAGGLAAVLPKCFVCVAGYAGLAVGAGWLGPELCGDPSGSGLTTGAVVGGLAAGVAVAVGLRGRGMRMNRAAVSGTTAVDRRET